MVGSPTVALSARGAAATDAAATGVRGCSARAAAAARSPWRRATAQGCSGECRVSSAQHGGVSAAEGKC